MNKWLTYSSHELAELATQGFSLCKTSQMTCPHCGDKSMRVYIHDLPNSAKSAEWLWCPDCCHQVHYCIASPHDRFSYCDPLAAPKYCDALLLSGDEWFDFLNALFDQHILPQTFISRSKK